MAFALHDYSAFSLTFPSNEHSGDRPSYACYYSVTVLASLFGLISFIAIIILQRLVCIIFHASGLINAVYYLVYPQTEDFRFDFHGDNIKVKGKKLTVFVYSNKLKTEV